MRAPHGQGHSRILSKVNHGTFTGLKKSHVFRTPNRGPLTRGKTQNLRTRGHLCLINYLSQDCNDAILPELDCVCVCNGIQGSLVTALIILNRRQAIPFLFLSGSVV